MPSSWKDLLSEVEHGNVRPLQERLKELGYSIADTELTRSVIGASTKDAVRQIQRRLGLEPTGKFDEATAVTLEREQPTVPDTSGYVVRGRILQPDGEAVIGAQVRAFDKQLRGDAIDLGHDTTNAEGAFTIRYRPDQLRPKGKLAADLIVRAYDRDGKELARSGFICQAPREATVDLVVGNVALRGPAEYNQGLKAITPYLGETRLPDLKSDEVAFLACSAKVDRVQIATLVVASRLGRDTGLPDWLFYALSRQGVELQLTAMLALSATRLKDALDRAIAANIVAPVEERNESALLDQLHTALVREAFREDLARGTFSVGALLDASLVDRALLQEFLSRYLRREGTLGDFWKGLGEDQRFTGAVIEDLRFTLVLGRLTGYQIPLLHQLKGLRQRQELAKLTDLAKVTRPRWRELLRSAANGGELDLPKEISGATYKERAENYISGIRRATETLLPGESLRVALEAAPETAQTVLRFLQNAPSLDLYWDDIDAKLAERGEPAFLGIADTERDGVVQSAKALQRLVRLSPHPDHVRILQAAGFHSAYSIARTPKQWFSKLFAEAAQELWESLDGAYTVEAPAGLVEEDS
jgi:hypothetical protein